MQSELKPYSLGIVIEDKEDGSYFVKVSPLEHLNIQPEEYIAEGEKEYKGDMESITEDNFQSELKSKNYFIARWIPLGHSNRMSAPDVYKNETIQLYKFGNVDEYYWTTIFNEPMIRRQETVIYSYSNLKEGLEAYDTKSSYWTKVDTKNKLVQFHTSDNDEEKTTYDIKMDTKKGILTIIDKQNNKIIINSEKKEINIESAGDMTIKAAKKLKIEAKQIDITSDSLLNIDAKLLNVSATLTSIKSKVILRGILIVTIMIFGRIIRKIPFIGF